MRVLASSLLVCFSFAKLEGKLHDVKTQLDNFVCENKVLEQLLLVAINERKVVEAIFEEMELEHEKTLSKNYLLENEVQNLKEKLQIYDINCGNLQAMNVGISNGRKLVAWQRRLFIVLLSFLVGLVMWEAEDVYLPLGAALVTVVAMSLSSLVQFFFAVRNKPALAAVALLSLNCFMLGTLTCPILPSFGRAVSSWAVGSANWLQRRLGFCA